MIEEDENDILDSGLTRHQTEIALKKARMAYEISKKKNMPVNKNYYALLIYKLEYELRLHTIPLRELKILALEYYRKHVELLRNYGRAGNSL